MITDRVAPLMIQEVPNNSCPVIRISVCTVGHVYLSLRGTLELSYDFFRSNKCKQIHLTTRYVPP